MMVSMIARRRSKMRSVIVINWFFILLRNLVMSWMSNNSRKVCARG